jgi:YD repeat-containing protein
MKFEEIPVGYYTGIPNVSIPITSAKLKNGQTLEVKLDYHPANINANQEASDCGLGWSLIAGGTISRTVKGYPDESRLTFGDPSSELTERVGIYQTSTSGSSIPPNKYYEYAELFENDEIDTDLDFVNEFLWDVNVKGKNDTEHDLYQYNFMGYTGRFFVKKENGALVVVKLDKNPLIITNTYNSTTYVHDSFTIVDEYGNQYLFNVKETSTYSDFFSDVNYTYIGAWNLAQIKDCNNITQASFNYLSTGKDEGISLSTTSFNHDKYGALVGHNQTYQGSTLYLNYSPLPYLQHTIATIMTGARKLDFIVVPETCYINFNYTQGRDDTLALLANGAKLSEIEIRTWKENLVKKFYFDYGYTLNNLKSRMVLNKVQLHDKNDEFISQYLLAYKQNTNDVPLGKDYWGYFNKKFCETTNRETAPGLSDIDILQQIQYPEGGTAVFDYESNSYSYEGDVALTDFSENPNNWQEVDDDGFHFYNNDEFTLNVSSSVQYVDIYPGVETTNDVLQNLYLYKNGTKIRFLACPLDCFDCKIRVILDANATYKLKLENYTGTAGVDVAVHYMETVSSPPQSLLGGGNRIKKISYFDDDSISGTPKKEVNYDYSFFDNSLKSSGSLVYPKPKYEYELIKRECPYQTLHSNTGPDDFDVTYEVVTLTDNLAAIKTKGAEVGYKNVTVSETDNGYKQLIFSSPIDYPETIEYENVNFPFLPTLNIDYKRGLLLEESIYRHNTPTQPIKHTVNTYSFVADTIKTGIKVYNQGGYRFNNVRKDANYSTYKYFMDNHTSFCYCCFDTPLAFTISRFSEEVAGWAKLDSTTSTESFYDGTTQTWSDVSITKQFEYNPINYKISKEIVTAAYGQQLQTEYFYPCDASMGSKPYAAMLVDRNMIGTPLVIQKMRGTAELFEKETEYGSFPSLDTSHPHILPLSIFTKKGSFSNTASKEITYDYDTLGNLIEFVKENGTPTSIVWGYKWAYPVAKIENCTYSSISQSLLDAIETATHPVSNTRAGAITALNALRAALPNAMVTTLTYESILGATSVTDAKGYTAFYEYDDFGRLKEVKDTYGNKLSENEYNYRPQN